MQILVTDLEEKEYISRQSSQKSSHKSDESVKCFITEWLLQEILYKMVKEVWSQYQKFIINFGIKLYISYIFLCLHCS